MADLTGQMLGKYQLVARLGRGGMADVYKGYQPGLDRYVAVKVMHAHLAEDADFITRFQREARAVARLRHPYIVQVHDFDVFDGHYYMVMEYVEGSQTLKELLRDLNARNQRLPLASTLDIVAKVADALDYAHRQGMVHRDIKPSNILLPTSDCPVLSDFGIAKLAGLTGLTSSGAMIGTPAYMSPEQGRGEPADERSDIYALGIVLYEMLVGEPPYDADTPYAVILKHINDPVVPPHVYVAGLPDSVERIVLRSLAKNPADRYETAGAMRDALQAALAALEDATRIAEATPPQGIEATAVEATLPASPPFEPETLPVAPVAQPSLGTTTRMARRGVPGWLWGVIAVLALAIIGGAVALLGLPGGEPLTTPEPAEEQVAGELAAGEPTERPAAPTEIPIPLTEPLPGDYLAVREGGIDLCRGEECAPLWLLEERAGYGSPTWAPTGGRFAFVACPSPSGTFGDCTAQSGLYIADREGNVTPLIPSVPWETPDSLNVIASSWSPDGDLIAFHGSGSLMVIRPDGSELWGLVEGGEGLCPFGTAWSPNSEQIAWVGGTCMPDMPDVRDHVWIVNRDGSNLRLLFQAPGEWLHGDIAWRPEGGAVAVHYDDDRAYLIDVACADWGGCGPSDVETLDHFPWDWTDWVYTP